MKIMILFYAELILVCDKRLTKERSLKKWWICKVLWAQIYLLIMDLYDIYTEIFLQGVSFMAILSQSDQLKCVHSQSSYGIVPILL